MFLSNPWGLILKIIRDAAKLCKTKGIHSPHRPATNGQEPGRVLVLEMNNKQTKGHEHHQMSKRWYVMFDYNQSFGD